jgi:hypothetical protein
MASLPSSCATRTPVTNWARRGIGRRGVTDVLPPHPFILFSERSYWSSSVHYSMTFLIYLPSQSTLQPFSHPLFREIKGSPRFPPGTQLLGDWLVLRHYSHPSSNVQSLCYYARKTSRSPIHCPKLVRVSRISPFFRPGNSIQVIQHGPFPTCRRVKHPSPRYYAR